MKNETRDTLTVIGQSSGDLLVVRISSLGTDRERRRLLSDWVHSGRTLNPLQASDIRTSFDFLSYRDENLLSVVCGGSDKRFRAW